MKNTGHVREISSVTKVKVLISGSQYNVEVRRLETSILHEDSREELRKEISEPVDDIIALAFRLSLMPRVLSVEVQNAFGDGFTLHCK